MTTNQPPIIPEGFLMDHMGNLVHQDNIKPQRLLEDETIAKIFAYAVPLSDQIARFKAHTLDDIDTYLDILHQEYSVTKGGGKGNLTLTSINGCRKVSVQNAEQLDFGAELQTAKALFDEIVGDLGQSVPPSIMALVETAFSVGKQGKINRENLFKVRDLEIDHPKWQNFRNAVNDSIRIVSSKTYVRLHKRLHPSDTWQAVSIDIATV